jgi:hypothetical protein
MKKIIAIFLLLVVCSVDGEEFKKPIQCTDAAKAFKNIREQFKEYPFILFKQDDAKTDIVLTINEQTKTWSLIEYNKTAACLLGSGSSFTIGDLNTVKYKPISF